MSKYLDVPTIFQLIFVVAVPRLLIKASHPAATFASPSDCNLKVKAPAALVA